MVIFFEETHDTIIALIIGNCFYSGYLFTSFAFTDGALDKTYQR